MECDRGGGRVCDGERGVVWWERGVKCDGREGCSVVGERGEV